MFNKEDFRGAAAVYSQALKKYPKRLNYYCGRAHMYQYSAAFKKTYNDNDLALADLTTYFSLDPSDKEGCLNYPGTQVWDSDKKFDYSWRFLDMVAKVYTGKKDNLHSARASVFEYMENFDSAIVEWSKAIELEPHANYFKSRASLYVKKKDYNAAIADYTKVIEIEKDLSYTNYENRAKAYELTGKSDLAKADIRKVAELQIKNYTGTKASDYAARGGIYWKSKDLDSAIREYTRAVELEPTEYRWRRDRAETYSDANKCDLAVADYSRLIELRPAESVLYNRRGICYAYLSKYDLAVIDYTKSLELRPNYADYINRANAYTRLGKNDLAAADRQKAATLKKN